MIEAPAPCEDRLWVTPRTPQAVSVDRGWVVPQKVRGEKLSSGLSSISVAKSPSIKGSRRGNPIFWLQMACSRPKSSPCLQARLRYLGAVRAIFAQKLGFPLGPPFRDRLLEPVHQGFP